MIKITVKEEIVTAQVVSLTLSEDVAVALKRILGGISLTTHVQNGVPRETAKDLESIYFGLNNGGIK